jgi:hypothetical protein
LTSSIQAFPAAVALTAVKGQTAAGSFNLQKAGTEQHTYGISTNQSWIWTNPPYNSSATISTELDKITVTVPTANLPVGTSSGVVYIVDYGSNNKVLNMLRVPVSITVTAGSSASAPSSTAVPPPPSPSTPTPIAGSGGTTPPPPPAVTPSLGAATITWKANSEADLAGYKVYIGTSSGIYSKSIDVGNVTSHRVTLSKGSTYFFAVTAYDKTGNESGKSAEISRSIF